ncbi:hypothetical protein [Methylobacterium gossipiicola]|uniref:hypothetical protein n=1 Tax=Methylobacterium gossipiicola TaxID=582675 RepID=UPI001FCDA3DB|nr:hypothetical protein [Methylobacterium gossipiicola]
MDLNAETVENFDALKKKLGLSTNTEVIRQALRFQRESLSIPERATEPTPKRPQSKKLPSARLLASNRKQITNYATILLEALQEALDYDPLRNHNSAPPALFIDDKKYRSDVAQLIIELRRLNDLLEKTTNTKAKTKSAEDVGNYLHLFMKNYTPALGKGAAYLTVGVIATLLAHLGLDAGMSKILPHLK